MASVPIKMKRKKNVTVPSVDELESQMVMMSVENKGEQWQRPASWREPRTRGEEIDQLVMEWYARQGLPVSEDQLIGKQLDEEDHRMWSLFLGLHNSDSAGGGGGGEERQQTPEEELGPRPEYGSKEFFIWWRKKTAMENAARAAQGLPPLPTKKEIEAEKAKKAAAKAAEKAAAVAAKEAEKAAKAAAKEAKAAEKAAKKKK